jgi:galactokinase
MIEDARWNAALAELYGLNSQVLAAQNRRWRRLIGKFHDRFGAAEVRCFSAPGRTEIGGNHTDHNGGKVLAAAVDLDSIAAAVRTADDVIAIYSEGYDLPFVVSLKELAPLDAERGTTSALMRGIAARFRQLGLATGGFHACIASDVPVGSGLSSSASIEVLIATILNALYNAGAVAPPQVAMIGQYAENVFFGKPCGLMDQIASAVGGIVKIDFRDPGAPAIEKLDFSLEARGFSLLVVDTGGNHADLTEEYASIPREMKAVAAQFGEEVCRPISESDVLGKLAELRRRAGDRAVLRALHFLGENERVDSEVAALRAGNLPDFLRLVRESGDSSYKWLQNCVAAQAGAQQGIPIALALAEKFLHKSGGACRVHGGGFAGTIQVFLPSLAISEFCILMESAFGAGCVKVLSIRPHGSREIADPR